jgi:hypothetical protein
MTPLRTVHCFIDKRTRKEFSVEVEVDVAELARMLAARALRSKHGKAQIAKGLIKARLIP